MTSTALVPERPLRPVVMSPGPWAALRGSVGWRARCAWIGADVGELPGDEPWRSAALQRAPALQSALVSGDDRALVAATRALVGLGEGSTPAGDDYLMGVLHALWALGRGIGDPGDSPRRATVIAGSIGDATTTLSAGWLSAAARGEVSLPWSGLLAALAGEDETTVRRAAAGVRACGHTSGAWSLAGFVATLA